MFGYNENYNANGSILGLIRLNMKGISRSQAKWFLFGIMVLNVAALFGGPGFSRFSGPGSFLR